MSAPQVSKRTGLCLVLFVSVAGILMITSCGGSSSSSTLPPQTIAPAAQNVQAITVNGGPLGSGEYPNGVFTSVTVCVPGTSTCQTIDGILVDTGSVGLRLATSVLTVALPQQTAADSNAVGECVQFGDGSYIWGPTATADVKMAGEVASAVPVHLLEDGFFTTPTSCTSSGGPEVNDPGTSGANGFLGVGLFSDDCGPGCASGTVSPPPGWYYECSNAAGCVPAFVAEAKQVTNPVALFTTDNNGVIVELPAVSGEAATVSGSLVFGIGTQSDNALGSATVLTPDSTYFNINTSFDGTSYSGANGGFFDTGSNAYYFPDNNIPECSDYTFFYCPSGPSTLTATNQGTNGKSTSVSFSVGNADQLLSNAGDNAFGSLAGPNGGFDWGLPFFFGRNVFVAIDGASTPGGTGPFFAY
jgi:hypothetical protein